MMNRIGMAMLLVFSSLTATKEDLVELVKQDPTLVLDIRYATDNNFTGHVLYKSSRAFLVREAAEKLCAVQKELGAQGFGLKIWDAYRPFSVQEELWRIVDDENYVAKPLRDAHCKPVQGSRHNRGCAIDVTIVQLRDGQELKMPTSYDNFTEKAWRHYNDLPEEILKNRVFLETVMAKHGFVGLPTEWWHFDYGNWQQYELLDIDYSDLK
jgi:D-alanyl-D-alanine dipeptidase